MIKWVRAEMGGMAKRKRSAALRFAVNLRETGGRSMNSVHRFWALPKDAGPDLGRLLAGRFHIWDAVAVSECRAEETQTLYWLLRDYCWGKQGEAVTWSRDFLQRHALVFNRVRGLRDGYLPCRGLSATGMTVISQPEICHFMLALARLPQEPPVARLYRLCRAAYRAQDYLLHQAPLLGAEMDRP